jgi:hypothetical protein
MAYSNGWLTQRSSAKAKAEVTTTIWPTDTRRNPSHWLINDKWPLVFVSGATLLEGFKPKRILTPHLYGPDIINRPLRARDIEPDLMHLVMLGRFTKVEGSGPNILPVIMISPTGHSFYKSDMASLRFTTKNLTTNIRGIMRSDVLTKETFKIGQRIYKLSPATRVVSFTAAVESTGLDLS